MNWLGFVFRSFKINYCVVELNAPREQVLREQPILNTWIDVPLVMIWFVDNTKPISLWEQELLVWREIRLITFQ